MIALLVDGPANGQIMRDLPGDTWVIEGWKLSMHQVGLFGEELEKQDANFSRSFPARYVRTALGDSQSVTFQFEAPRFYG